MKECTYLKILPKAILDALLFLWNVKNGGFHPHVHTTIYIWEEIQVFAKCNSHDSASSNARDLTWGCLVFFQSYSCHWSNHRSCKHIQCFNFHPDCECATYEIRWMHIPTKHHYTKQGSNTFPIHESLQLRIDAYTIIVSIARCLLFFSIKLLW